MRIVFGSSGGGNFERSKGNLFVVFLERISVHPAIMDDTSIK